jgi:hypothetical protein
MDRRAFITIVGGSILAARRRWAGARKSLPAPSFPGLDSSSDRVTLTDREVAEVDRRVAPRVACRDPLVERFFHSFAAEDKYPDAPTRIVKWQGRILGRVDDRTYRVELLSWGDGKPNGQRLQSIAEMADWKFYSTASEMNEWYENTYRSGVKHYDFGVRQ